MSEESSITPPTEPVMITVDYAFELLQAALNRAVEMHGNNAKAFAWDVKGHFIDEIGSMRSGARVGRLPPPPAALGALNNGGSDG